VSKRALICGISGQDGAYLAKLLLDKGYEVWGTSRDAEMVSFENLRTLGVRERIHLVSLNLRDIGGIINVLSRIQPHELYNLAAQSSVGLSFEQPYETLESISLGGLNLLEAIRLTKQPIRLYNAGSTECFGETGLTHVDEQAPFNPRSPYAVAKAAAHWMVSNYREAHGMFACTGILSNHDSPLRPKRFVTRKIIRAVAEIASGRGAPLSLGNLDIERDWGWAPEYVDAIWRILQQDTPEDFIIATGVSSTLQDFVRTAYELIDMNWRDYVTVDNTLLRPSEILHSRMNPALAAERLGWKATYTMKEVVRAMFEEELRRMNGDEIDRLSSL
jgi:GDPmannose 4,6-dehydratase